MAQPLGKPAAPIPDSPGPDLRRGKPFSDIWYTAFARVVTRGSLQLSAEQKAAIIDALRRSGNPRRTYEACLVFLIRLLNPAQMKRLQKTLLTRVPIESLAPQSLPASADFLNACWVQTLDWLTTSLDVDPKTVKPAVPPADTTSEALSGIPSLPQHWILSLNYALRSGDVRLSRAQGLALLPPLAAAGEADRAEARLRQTLDTILDADQRKCISDELRASEVNGLVIMDENGPKISDADQFLNFMTTTPVTDSTSRAY